MAGVKLREIRDESASQKHPNGGKPIHAPDSVTARENAAKVAMAIVYNKTLPPKPQTTTPLPPPPPLTASVTDGLLLTEKDKKKTHYIDRRRHQKTKSQSQKWVGSQYPSSSSHQGMYRMHSGYFYCYYPLCGGPSNFHGMMGHGFQPQAQGQSQGEGQWCWWWNPNFCIAPPPLSPLQMMYPPPNGLQLLPPPGYQHYPLPQTEPMHHPFKTFEKRNESPGPIFYVPGAGPGASLSYGPHHTLRPWAPEFVPSSPGSSVSRQ